MIRWFCITLVFTLTCVFFLGAEVAAPSCQDQPPRVAPWVKP